VEKLAAFLKPLRLSVEAVWHSGKPRAAETAVILAGAVVSKAGRADAVQRDGLSPNSSVEAVAKELAIRGEDLMIVGHMPFLGKLASLLVKGSPTGEVVAFRKTGNRLPRKRRTRPLARPMDGRAGTSREGIEAAGRS